MSFEPWQVVVDSPATTLAAYTIVSVTQDSQLAPAGTLTDVVEYAYTIDKLGGVFTTQVPLATVRAGFGDIAIAEDVARVQALYAL